MRLCKKCNIEKPDSEYYKRTNGHCNYSRCKDCTKKYNREKSMQPDQRNKRLLRQKEYGKKNKQKYYDYSVMYYESKIGRVKSLMKSAKRRGEKLGFDIDEEFILNLMESDKCAVTGIPFDYKKPIGTVKNPYAPSLDRINSSCGYTKDNVRLVIWQYNLMKGEISDSELLQICRRVVGDRY